MKRIVLGVVVAFALMAGSSGLAGAAWDHGPGDTWDWFACCYY